MSTRNMHDPSESVSPRRRNKPEPLRKRLSSKLSINRSCPTSPSVRKAYRLVVAGSCRTGKSSLVQRFLGRNFEERYNPTIENFHRQFYKHRSELYQLDVFDTSGNDPFPAARRLSFISGDMFVLVCSVDVLQSFTAVFQLWQEVLQCRNEQNAKQPPIVIAVNKTDLPKREHLFSMEDVEEHASHIDNCRLIVQCSAKDETGIREVFERLFTVCHLPKSIALQFNHRKVQQVQSDVPSSSSQNEPCTSHSQGTTPHPLKSCTRPSLDEDLRLAHQKQAQNHSISSNHSIRQWPNDKSLLKQLQLAKIETMTTNHHEHNNNIDTTRNKQRCVIS